jgi:hypothetical protein
LTDCHQIALGELAQMDDLLERARAAGTFIETCTAAQAEAGEVRREAIAQLVGDGYRRSQLAIELGLAAPRITQILRDTTLGAERRFFDGGPLTVAVAGKHAAEKPEPVVSADSLAAWETLRTLAEQYRHSASYEVIPPPGHELRLNRPGLVVLGSPRLLPFAGQIVDSDPSYGFKEDGDGWYLVDRVSDVAYRSPMDAGKPSDYAYVGRLPRPDGRGTWLYIAGIHGPGTRGAARWLAEHLTEVYRIAKAGRFAVLIASHINPKTKKVIETEVLTEVRVPETR